MRGVMIAAALGLVVSGAALAETVLTQKQAKRALFGVRGTEGAVSQTDKLSDQDRAILAEVAKTQKYYGAIAFSPDEGLLSEATVAAANYHSVEPAREAALAECNSKRASGAQRCVIGADILPKRYEPGRAIQLNMDATVAVGKEYRRLRGNKAFSISSDTGEWGFGASEEEAQAACASKGARDCRVVLRD